MKKMSNSLNFIGRVLGAFLACLQSSMRDRRSSNPQTGQDRSWCELTHENAVFRAPH
jgi:hypothetical protein